MGIKSFQFTLIFSAMTNLVTSSTSWSVPSICRDVHKSAVSPSITTIQKNIQLARELNNLSLDFAEFLVRKQAEGKVEKSEFNLWVQKIDLKTKEYLDSAGIRYDRTISTNETVSNRFKEIGADFEFPSYQIVGGGIKGDLTAQMLDGVLQNKKLAGLKIILDPFLFLSRMNTMGGFEPKEFRLVLTPFALAQDALGIGSTFRHEIQHAFENVKLKNGEKTLSSFQGSREDRKDNGPYTNFMSLDELETHLRDLRFLKNIAPTHDKYLGEELRAKAIDLRKNQIKQNINTIQSLILKSKFVLSQLNTVKQTETLPYISALEGDLRVAMYYLKTEGAFDIVTFKSKFRDEQAFKESMAENIEWATKRIGEIQSEVQTLSSSGG